MIWCTVLLLWLITGQVRGSFSNGVYEKGDRDHSSSKYDQNGHHRHVKYEPGKTPTYNHDNKAKYEQDGHHGHVDTSKYDHSGKQGRENYDHSGKHGRENYDHSGKHGLVNSAKYDHNGKHGLVNSAKYDHSGKHGLVNSAKYDHSGKRGLVKSVKYDHSGKHGLVNNAKYDHSGKQGLVDSAKYNHSGKQGLVNSAKYDHSGKHGLVDSAKNDHSGKHGLVNSAKYDHSGKHGLVNSAKYDHSGKHGLVNSAKYDHSGKHGLVNSAKYDHSGKQVHVNSKKYDHTGKQRHIKAVNYDHGKHGHDSKAKYDHSEQNGHAHRTKYDHNGKQDNANSAKYDHTGKHGRVNRQHSSHYGKWSDWGPCSVTCGNGHQQRTRSCLSSNHGRLQCDGTLVETKVCHRGYFKDHKDGHLSEWSKWSQCSNDCEYRGKKNYRYRTRDCIRKYGDSAPCNGLLKERERCNSIPCQTVDHPQPLKHSKPHRDVYLTGWSDWGPCSVSCGEGFRERERGCYGSIPKHCEGLAIEQVMPCHRGPCNGIWTGWSDWGPCSHRCEKYGKKNYRFRTRTCVKPTYGGSPCKGGRKQREACNEIPCSIYNA